MISAGASSALSDTSNSLPGTAGGESGSALYSLDDADLLETLRLFEVEGGSDDISVIADYFEFLPYCRRNLFNGELFIEGIR